MLEWVIPISVGIAALTVKGGSNDKKKIEQIFKRNDYCVKSGDQKKYPTFKKKWPIEKNKVTLGTCYAYTIPTGLPITKRRQVEDKPQLFIDALGKYTEIKFKKGLLRVNVYHGEIPKRFEYELVPSIEGWKIPLGLSPKGIVWHDFDKTPHGTVAGTTRFGKTVFLKLIMTYLIEHHPDEVEFYIIDLKGGLEFKPYEKLKQVKYVSCNAYEGAEMLKGIIEQMEKDFLYFAKNGWTNIVDTWEKKRRFVIVDEGAQLAPDTFHSKDESTLLKFCQGKLSEIARIGGALGYRLIFCTQYPTSDTLPRQIKQNADLKITFRLPTSYASLVAIDDVGADELPSDIPGRAIIKTHEQKIVQVPYISDKEMKQRLKQWEVQKHDPHHAPKNEESTGGDTFYIR